MKINLATILLIALSTVGVISLTSSNLSSAVPIGNTSPFIALARQMESIKFDYPGLNGEEVLLNVTAGEKFIFMKTYHTNTDAMFRVHTSSGDIIALFGDGDENRTNELLVLNEGESLAIYANNENVEGYITGFWAND